MLGSVCGVYADFPFYYLAERLWDTAPPYTLAEMWETTAFPSSEREVTKKVFFEDILRGEALMGETARAKGGSRSLGNSAKRSFPGTPRGGMR